MDRLKQAMTSAKRYERRLAIQFMDLSQLKRQTAISFPPVGYRHHFQSRGWPKQRGPAQARRHRHVSRKALGGAYRGYPPYGASISPKSAKGKIVSGCSSGLAACRGVVGYVHTILTNKISIVLHLVIKSECRTNGRHLYNLTAGCQIIGRLQTQPKGGIQRPFL